MVSGERAMKKDEEENEANKVKAQKCKCHFSAGLDSLAVLVGGREG